MGCYDARRRGVATNGAVRASINLSIKREASVKRLISVLLCLVVAGLGAGLAAGFARAGDLEECTTAVIAGAATADGNPILWKNRDTDSLSNKIVLVHEQPHDYLAVVNAAETSGRIVWGGLNSAGFAIINSVAYNLPQESGEAGDLEGHVMADALRSCATADDFENYLKANLGAGLGVQANFCVIDAKGGAAIFETHNHGYQRLDAAAAPEKYLLNTNFSRSGKADKGAGYLRFDRENELFRAVPAGKLTHGFILQTAARDLGDSRLQHPERAEWKKLPADRPSWIHANYTIDRGATACAMVIHGVKPGEDPRNATLWVILGEPVCSIAIPLWVAAGETPVELRASARAPIYQEALRLQERLRPLPGRDRREYLDLGRLDNRAGTGWLPGHLELERAIIEETARLLQGDATPAQLADFERATAARVLGTLQRVP
jgi:hypothetical protein